MLQLTTIIFLIAFSMLAMLHIVGIQLFLYWHFWWFDILIHGFGGAIVALGFFALRDLKLFPNRSVTLIRILALTFVIALVWEAFEYLAGVPVETTFVTDTITDLLMGIVGAVAGFFIGNSLRHLS
jgi:uncharacterized membrane protein YoaK (UPF0700 family)